MSTDRTLTRVDFERLSKIVAAVTEHAEVAFMDDGHSVYGEARSFGDRHGMAFRGADMRDMYLRVTLKTSGVERFELVSDLMERLGNETFFILGELD